MLGLGSSIYFFGYAFISLLSLITMFFGMKTRKKREGKDINYSLLKALASLTVLMTVGGVGTIIHYI